MSVDRIVAIGASAGGIEGVRAIVGSLPSSFTPTICVVVHTSPQSPGVLVQILQRASALPVSAPRNRDRIKAGQVYVATPDCHLVVEPGRFRVTKGPKENRFRPAVDPLFRSAAQVYGPAATGVILSGNLDDGTAGLWTIRQLGGVCIVQDPLDAQFPDMPRSAAEHVSPDYILPLAQIPDLLIELARRPVEERIMATPENVDIEVRIAKEENAVAAGLERIGSPSRFACPECHGVLLQLKGGDRERFRCHTGHAYSLESLLAALLEGIEESLWTSSRSLEEGVMLLSKMAEHLAQKHQDKDATALLKRAEEFREQSDTIRRFISERVAVGTLPTP